MIDNDKLLQKYGEKETREYYSELEGCKEYEIIHAIPTGSRNVSVIKIRKVFEIGNSFERVKVILQAEEEYQEMKNKLPPDTAYKMSSSSYTYINLTNKYCGTGKCDKQCEKCKKDVKITQAKTQRLIIKIRKNGII